MTVIHLKPKPNNPPEKQPSDANASADVVQRLIRQFEKETPARPVEQMPESSADELRRFDLD